MKRLLTIVALFTFLNAQCQNGNVTVPAYDTVSPYIPGLKVVLKPTNYQFPLKVVNDTTVGVYYLDSSYLLIQANGLDNELPSTPIKGLHLQDTTHSASSIHNLLSPPIYFEGQGYGTTLGQSYRIFFRMYNKPISGTVPTAELIVEDSIAGLAGWNLVYKATISTGANGTFTVPGNIVAPKGVTVVGMTWNSNNLPLNYGTQGVPYAYLTLTAQTIASAAMPVRTAPGVLFKGYEWSGTGSIPTSWQIYGQPYSDSTSTIRHSLVFMSQDGAGAFVNKLTLHNDGQMAWDGVINTKAYTVATLPTGHVGDEAYVTDATSPSYLTTVTGGGSTVCPVFYNGTNWVCH